MRKVLFGLVGLAFVATGAAAAVSDPGANAATQYEVSFDNARHHEAQIVATYRGVPRGPLKVRMSRSSPGRYAIHEFAKNVYKVSAVDGSGFATRGIGGGRVGAGQGRISHFFMIVGGPAAVMLAHRDAMPDRWRPVSRSARISRCLNTFCRTPQRRPPRRPPKRPSWLSCWSRA